MRGVETSPTRSSSEYLACRASASHFGWDVNGTYIDGQFNNIRQWQVNTAGIYDDGTISARVSWTWSSKYQEGTAVGAQPNSLWVAPRNNVDASINYNINDNLQIGLDATNIMGSRYRSFGHAAGNDIELEMDVFAAQVRRFDRTIAMTARYRYLDAAHRCRKNRARRRSPCPVSLNLCDLDQGRGQALEPAPIGAAIPGFQVADESGAVEKRSACARRFQPLAQLCSRSGSCARDSANRS